MKTKSKLVLGLSILSAATLAAGATSTFAWYQTSAAVSGTYGSPQAAGLQVTANNITAMNLAATLHFEVGENTQKGTNNTGTNLYISDWKDNGQGENPRYTLSTGYQDSRDNVYYQATPADGVLFYTFPITAWLENTSSNTSDDAKASWVDALENSDAKVTYTFSVDETALTSPNVALGESDVVYYISNTAAVNKDAETDPVHAIENIEVANFITGNYYSHTATAGTKMDLGYLVVRIDATARDHSTDDVYKASIVGAPSTASFTA